jgi:hypothetical protein
VAKLEKFYLHFLFQIISLTTSLSIVVELWIAQHVPTKHLVRQVTDKAASILISESKILATSLPQSVYICPINEH